MDVAVLYEALARADLLNAVYAISQMSAGPIALGAGESPWHLKYHCDRQELANLKSDHTYQICNDSSSRKSVEIIVDGVTQDLQLAPGSCRDIEGKKIEVHMEFHGSGATAGGTYKRLL